MFAPPALFSPSAARPAACGVAVVLGLLLGTGCQHAKSNQRVVKPLATHAMPGGVTVHVLRADPSGQPNTTISLLEVALDPLGGSPPHRHPGPVSGRVLEGTFVFQVGDNPQQPLHAGDTFFEPTMALHRVGRNPSPNERTIVSVTMVHPTDAKQLVIPEPMAP